MKTIEIAKVFRLTFPKMILVAVFFAAMYTVALLLLHANVFQKNGEVTYDSAFGSITPFSTAIFVSILGSIVLAIYFERFLSMGITRKNILLGFFTASCVLAACFSLVSSITGFLLEFYTFAEACMMFCSFLLTCANELLAGFAVVVGFLFLRWYTSVTGIVFCIIISNLTISVSAGKTPLIELLPITPPSSPPGQIALLLGIVILVLLMLLQIVSRVPFKC